MKRNFVLGTTILSLLTANAGAENLYWDGVTGGWDLATNWSTASGATTPDPSLPPDADDLAVFNITGQNAATTVSLNGPQAALGLSFLSSGVTTLQGGGTNQVLSLALSGITTGTSATVINIGSSAPGQNVAVSLQGSQTWAFNGTNVLNNGIFVRNGVSLGVAGAHTLTLGGSSSSNAVNRIEGTISNGSGILGLTMSGGVNNRWNLNGNNSYSDLTSITGGALGIAHANALGGTDVGTEVASGAALFLRTGTTYAAEPLSIAGIGPSSSARGALRLISGTAVWTGAITASAVTGAVRIG